MHAQACLRCKFTPCSPLKRTSTRCRLPFPPFLFHEGEGTLGNQASIGSLLAASLFLAPPIWEYFANRHCEVRSPASIGLICTTALRLGGFNFCLFQPIYIRFGCAAVLVFSPIYNFDLPRGTRHILLVYPPYQTLGQARRIFVYVSDLPYRQPMRCNRKQQT